MTEAIAAIASSVLDALIDMSILTSLKRYVNVKKYYYGT